MKHNKESVEALRKVLFEQALRQEEIDPEVADADERDEDGDWDPFAQKPSRFPLPSDDILTRWADGTMRSRERKAFEASLSDSLMNSLIAADFEKRYEKVRALVQGPMGGRGIWLSALNKLPEDVRDDWEALLARSEAMRRREKLVREILSKPEIQADGTVAGKRNGLAPVYTQGGIGALAGATVCTLVFLVVVPRKPVAVPVTTTSTPMPIPLTQGKGNDIPIDGVKEDDLDRLEKSHDYAKDFYGRYYDIDTKNPLRRWVSAYLLLKEYERTGNTDYQRQANKIFADLHMTPYAPEKGTMP